VPGFCPVTSVATLAGRDEEEETIIITPPPAGVVAGAFM
jgi:hypothetical protein